MLELKCYQPSSSLQTVTKKSAEIPIDPLKKLFEKLTVSTLGIDQQNHENIKP